MKQMVAMCACVLGMTDQVFACPENGATAGITGAERINIGSPVNAWDNNCEAQVSADGQTLFFNYHHGKQAKNGGLYRSRWSDAEKRWSEPELLVKDGHMPTVTRDERRIYFPMRGRLWMIEQTGTGDGYGAPKAVQFEEGSLSGADLSGIDTPTVDPEGNQLIFVMNNDLYESRRESATEIWTSPRKLDHLSGAGKEWHPFITYDGQRLIYNSTSFSESSSFLTMVSEWDSASQTWGEPAVMGEFGCSPSLTEDGLHLYYGGRYEGGYGALDIWTEKLSSGIAKEQTEERPGNGGLSESRWCSLGRLPGVVSVGALAVTRNGEVVALSSDGTIYRQRAGTGHGTPVWEAVFVTAPSCLPHLMEDKPMVALVSLPSGTLLAASPQGIVRSTDDGATWESVRMPSYVAGVRALTRDRAGNLLWGATDEGMIVRSQDDGQSWALVGKASSMAIVRALAVDEQGRLFVAGDGALARSSIQRSDDGGMSWNEVALLQVSGSSKGYSLLWASHSALYAGVWTHGDETTSGIYRTDDGQSLGFLPPLPGEWQDKRIPSFVEVNNTLYAGVATHPSGDLVFYSEDHGATWQGSGSLWPSREVFDLAALPDGSVVAGTAPFGEVFRLRSSESDPCWPVQSPMTDEVVSQDGCTCASSGEDRRSASLLAAFLLSMVLLRVVAMRRE